VSSDQPPGEPSDQDPLDLGAALRILRRRGDLSQRQLAERAGVPASTVARIESGEITNPRIRTVERLARAAGGAVRVGVEPHRPAEPIPHERRTDAAGRHYPAHLDVRVTYPYVGRDYRILPAGTAVYGYDQDRTRRDAARARAAVVAELPVDRYDRPGGGGWLWVARTAAGEAAGRLGAVLLPPEWQGAVRLPDTVVCGLEMAAGWRDGPLERRLLGHLREELAGRGPTELVTITHLGMRIGELRQLGFHRRPATVTLLAARP
jgi:transcriptional regulator with XRE-family HTH domain